jgi:asparagine synthase (glutamine-hydrolysing)
VAHAYPLVRQILMDKKISSLLHGEALSPNVVAQLAAAMGQQHLPLLSKVSVLEMQTYMQNVLLRDTDQMSMAHALEVRVPFLDHRLVHLILGVNDEMKYPHSPKQLLTDAVGDLIPREIIDRPKMGFTFPWAKWMKEDLKSFCEEQLAYLKGLKSFDERALELMWNGFLNNDPMVSWSRIWPLVVLGFWLKKQEVSD